MVQKLRNICVRVRGEKNKWKEQNPKESAKLLHELGLIYKGRELDKISLIQSAGLLNAALVRRSDNEEQVRQDLIELHQIVVKHADANCNANLEEEASFVKEKFQSLRSEIRKDLEDVKQLVDINNVRAEMKKIEKMTQIQNCISNEYVKIMAELSKRCETIMGKPPCKYALIGMGSLARKEITPYSDFEHAIVLEDNNSKENPCLLEYFRWFSVIFHIIVLNLQETIVPSLHIPVLNDKTQHFGDWFFDDVTPSGISFDGMMPHACKFPLGRQNPTKNKPFTTELIGSVVEMLNYLSEEEDLKNGYHLSDILSQTCFVFGDETVYNSFADGAKAHYKKKSDKALKEEVKQQVEEDLNKFSIRRNISKLKLSKKINIKSNVYRAISLFISALRKLCKISKPSSFDVISELEKNEIFSSYGSQKLRFALVVACEMRLRLCMNSGSQHGHVRTSQCESQKKKPIDFLHLVGKPSTLNLLQITFCLQAKVADLIDFDETKEFSRIGLFNISLCYKLNCHQLVTEIFSGRATKAFNEADIIEKFDFDRSPQGMEAMTTRTTRAKDYLLNSNVSIQTKQNGFDFFSVAIVRFKSEFVEEAKEFFCFALEIFKKLKKKKDKILIVASGLCHLYIGFCWKKLRNYSQCKKCLKKSLEIFSNAKQTSVNDINVELYAASAHLTIGRCWMKSKKSNLAKQSFDKALVLLKNLSSDKHCCSRIAAVSYEIGKYLLYQGRPRDAILKLQDSQEIYLKTSLHVERDESIARVAYDIGCCYRDLKEYDDALKNLIKSSDIYRALHKIDDQESLANVLFDIAFCYMKKEHFEGAVDTFLESLKTLESFEKKQRKAEIHGHVGWCLMQLKKYDKSLKYFHKKLGYYESISKNPDKTKAISDVSYDMGCCCMDKEDYNQAIIHFEKSLDTTKKTMFKSYADRLRRLGICYLLQSNYKASLQHLKKSSDKLKKIELNFNMKKKLAEILVAISQCKLGLIKKRKAESKLLLKEAFDIYSKLFADGKIDKEVYHGLNGIGVHLIELGQFEEALNCFNKSKEVLLHVASLSDSGSACTQLLQNKSVCLISLDRRQEAIVRFEEFLNNLQKLSIDNESKKAADIMMQLGVYFMKLGENRKSMKLLKKSLTIYENYKDEIIVKTLINKFFC